jgi:hypothetical protein
LPAETVQPSARAVLTKRSPPSDTASCVGYGNVPGAASTGRTEAGTAGSGSKSPTLERVGRRRPAPPGGEGRTAVAAPARRAGGGRGAALRPAVHGGSRTQGEPPGARAAWRVGPAAPARRTCAPLGRQTGGAEAALGRAQDRGTRPADAAPRGQQERQTQGGNRPLDKARNTPVRSGGRARRAARP